MRFRKKVVEIEAKQLADQESSLEIAMWMKESNFEGFRIVNAAGEMEIVTLEGTMLARIGDWVAKGIKGEFYPIKPHIFVDLYEPA